MKVKQLQKQMMEKGIDYAIFLENDPNGFYFSGFKEGSVIIPCSGKPKLIVSEMEEERALKGSIIDVSLLKDKRSLDDYLIKLIGNGNIGVNKARISAITFEKYKRQFKGVRDVSKTMKELRSIKTITEINNIQEVCRLTDRVFSKVLNNFSEFRTESDIVVFIESLIKKKGYIPSFDTIVASGKKSSMPHYIAGNNPLKKGFCIIDFGIKYKGYCSDMTRTVYIGKVSKKELQTYNVVLEAQSSAINAIHNGIPAKGIDKHARDILGKCFLHSTGHGIGVEIHESPDIGPGSVERIRKGMVFTIEPGFYERGKFGIRIEDDVVLGNKVRIFTKSNRELIQI